MSAGAVLHLTFDDGPDPEWTPRVLRLLADHDATATFFPMGNNVRRFPELVARVQAAGHTVGVHGDRHLDHSKVAPDVVAADTERALRDLTVFGVPTVNLWRLPWGRRGPATDEIAAVSGLRIVGWDVDTHDWRGDGWHDQPGAVGDAARTGGVVLLHDGLGPGATRTGVDNTLEIVDHLLRLAHAAGTPVRALRGAGRPVRARA